VTCVVEGISSKHARFGIKLFELFEAKSYYVWNFIIYTEQDIAFNEALKKVVRQLMALLNQVPCNYGQLVFKPRSVP
jgi:hypothetical protein